MRAPLQLLSASEKVEEQDDFVLDPLNLARSAVHLVEEA